MQTLQGQGKIEFGEAKLDTLWPGAIPLAVDAGLKAEPDKLAASRQARPGLRSVDRQSAARQKAFALELADGQLRVKSFAIDTREGRATGIASLDLKALTFNSQWRLEAKAGVSGAAGKQLPAVIVVYSGPVAALGATEPRIDSAALEQELSARKIERDVEELERLRRLDEQRRQTEVGAPAQAVRADAAGSAPVRCPPACRLLPPAANRGRQRRVDGYDFRDRRQAARRVAIVGEQPHPHRAREPAVAALGIDPGDQAGQRHPLLGGRSLQRVPERRLQGNRRAMAADGERALDGPAHA